MATIDAVLASAVEQGASDIHFSSGETPWVRIDGDLVRFGEHVYSPMEMDELLTEILSEAEKHRLTAEKNLDKSYAIEGLGNFRVNVFYSRNGMGAVIRSLPIKMPNIDDLGLPPVVKQLAAMPKGLILVTGPTGSGKSTTLAAMINYINQNFAYHVLTAEDPIEFVHPNQQSLITQREIGHSCPTFADALKYALREDPDVILVGELRDIETIGLAMTAAETGHLVLGTLHTRGAAATMDRIIETFPANQQSMARAMLADSLQGVISQTLLRKAEGKGRVAVYEVMVTNFAISNLIREGKTFQISSIMQTGRKEGNLTMENHARELIASGAITAEDGEALIGTLTRGTKGTSTTGSAAPQATASAPTLKTAAPPNTSVAATSPSAPAMPASKPARPPTVSVQAKPSAPPAMKPAGAPPLGQPPIAVRPANPAVKPPAQAPRPVAVVKPAAPAPVAQPAPDDDIEVNLEMTSAPVADTGRDDTGYTNMSSLQSLDESSVRIDSIREADPVPQSAPVKVPAPRPIAAVTPAPAPAAAPAPEGKRTPRPMPIPKKAG